MEPSDIPDALPDDFPREGEGPASPYKNLLVPLIVVPAMIVMVLVLVWVLFGSLAGSEKGPQENLDRMIEGSSNERDQAAQLLVSQIYGYLQAKSEGRESEWEIDETFLPAVQRGLEDIDEEDVQHRYVLAFFQRQLGDPEGLPHLIELLSLSDELDEGAKIRFLTVRAIGGLAPAYDEREVRLAAGALVPILDGEDAGLRLMAAAALQNLPCEEALTGLRGALGDAHLDVRGSAAISLARLGDPAGAEVLRELLDPAAYAAEHAQDPERWYRAEQVSASRILAVRALAELGRPEDLAVLEAADATEDDQNVLAEIKGALRDAARD